jgi:hypothetical protein
MVLMGLENSCHSNLYDDIIFVQESLHNSVDGVFLLRLGVSAASNSAYHGYPELLILRYPAHRYHDVPSPGFEPMTLWLSPIS